MAEIDLPHVMRQIETFMGTALVDADDVEEDEFDVPYTVAEWVPGASLAVAVEAAGPRAGLRWVAQIARAVAYLHAFRSPAAPDGVIHRDVKPSNVRIFDDRAVLIDFGIARAHDSADLTQGAGTYLWRAPETIGGPGQPGPASDAWGVGALAYWVLTGEPPRLEATATIRERLTAIARDRQLPDPEALGLHITRLLETHPDDRPDDLNHWADELDALIATAAEGRTRRPRSRPMKHRRTAAVAAGLLVAALAGGAVALAATGGSGSPEAHGSSSTTTGLATATTSTTNVPASTTPPATTTPAAGTFHARILNARTNAPFAAWAKDEGSGPLLRVCPKVGCISNGAPDANDAYFGADANGDVVVRTLDPAVEYSFTAMAIDIDGCPPYYQEPSNPRNGDHKYWFAPEMSGTPSEVEGTAFMVVDNC
jgi:hypothetical protein